MTLRMSEQVNELAGALAKAQGSFGTIPKAKTATIRPKDKPAYSYSYADLGDVLDAARSVLAENGLAVSQPLVIVGEGHRAVATLLMHSSGQWIESLYPVASYDRPQDMGSAITYARRYALCAILGIAAEEDDDGQAAQGAAPQSSSSRKRSERARTQEPAPAPAPESRPDDTPRTRAMRRMWVTGQQKFGPDAESALRLMLRDGFGKESTKDMTDEELSRLIADLETMADYVAPEEGL